MGLGPIGSREVLDQVAIPTGESGLLPETLQVIAPKLLDAVFRLMAADSEFPKVGDLLQANRCRINERRNFVFLLDSCSSSSSSSSSSTLVSSASYCS